MRNSSTTSLLRKSSAIFGVVLFATPTGASISMDNWAPVSDMELAGKRGAYIARNGLEIEFGATYYAIIDGTFKEDLDAGIDRQVDEGLSGIDPQVEVAAEPALPAVEVAAEPALPEVEVAAEPALPEVEVVEAAIPSVAEVAATPGLPSENVDVTLTPELPVGTSPQAAGAALSFAKAVMDVPLTPSPEAQGRHMAPPPAAQSHANLGGGQAALPPSPGVAAAARAPAVALVSTSKPMPEPALPPTPAASMRARVEFENEFAVGDDGGVQQEEITLGHTRIVQRVSADGVVGVVLNRANNISIRQFVEIQVRVRNFSEIYDNPARLSARAASRLMNEVRFHSIQ